MNDHDLLKIAPELLRKMELGEVSKTLTNAAEILAPNPTMKKKILVGVILGGIGLGTYWAIRTWRNYQKEHDSDIEFVDWLFFRPSKR